MGDFRPIVEVQSEPLPTDQDDRARLSIDDNTGAVVAFEGLCRSENGALTALELEHYAGMAEKKLKAIADEAVQRWPLTGLLLRHRHGVIAPGETIVRVIACSSHRSAAFEAANFVMDFLKTDAPFWKREHRKDGDTSWVGAKSDDDIARDRWS